MARTIPRQRWLKVAAWISFVTLTTGLRSAPPTPPPPPPPPPPQALEASSMKLPELDLSNFKPPPLPDLPTMTMPALPSLTMPDLPSLTMPELPSVGMPDLSASLPPLPPLPTLPDMPAFDLLPPELAASVAGLAAVFSHVNPSEAPVAVAPLAVLFGAALGQAWARIGVLEAGDGLPYEAGDNKSAGGTGYSDAAAEAFFAARPLVVAKRLLQLTRLTGTFNVALLLDYLATPRLPESEGGGKATPWNNEPARARDALALANQMGPTFIKLGQALSIRTDLISEAYALELRQLQDAVPPFDSNEAFAVLRRELGVKDLSTVFRIISAEPVASASIGQVYRGTLLDGRDVAVKVQRPSVLADIALDLYILRLLTPLQVRVSNAINKIPTDQGDIDVALQLVDEWGRGFVAEVDYVAEARNTMEFSAAMERRGLNAVTAPTVVTELSSSKVLVTEWVEGTRLDRDASDDVPRLCGVAINAYLTMLLDTGTLHCDPHPGNLLRTTDGRLCVLDWGMTLSVPGDLQYGLLEFIAHVNSGDFDAIPADFVNLGFTPPDKLERVKNSGITEGLTFALQQLSAGGGPSKIRERVKEEFLQRYGPDLTDEELRAKAREEMMASMEAQLEAEGVDVNGVTNVMEEMSRRNRELFKLPPYVLYVSRAFSTLEGIGLSIDEDYAILQECYPYLARRLFTDNSPRARVALRSMLYGPQSQQQQQQPPLTMTVASGQQVPILAGADANGNANGSGMGSSGGGGGGLLSPDKLQEMTDGFTSYTAATTDADTTKGLEEAGTALAELLLASAEENRANARLSASFASVSSSSLSSSSSVAASFDASDLTSMSTLGVNKNAVVNNDPYGYGYYDPAETSSITTRITEDGEEIFDYGTTTATTTATAAATATAATEGALAVTAAAEAEAEASDLNLVQELLVDEAAKFVDAAVRSQLEPIGRILESSSTSSSSLSPSASSASASAAAAAASSSSSSTSTSSPTEAAASLLFGAPLQASRALYSTLNGALPEPLRPLAAPLAVPSQLAAAAAPLLVRTPEDDEIFATAEAIASVLQKTADGAGVAGAAAHSAAAPVGVGSDSGGSSSSDGGSAGGVDGSSSNNPVAAAAAASAAAEESLRGATAAARQAVELLTTGDEKVAGLRAKVPGAAANLSRRFAANLVARGVGRLEGATAQQLAAGELREGDFVVTSRRNVADAARQVVSALSTTRQAAEE